jgi:hypothetical protein
MSKKYTIKKGLLLKKKYFLKVCFGPRESDHQIKQPNNFNRREPEKDKYNRKSKQTSLLKK